LTCSGLTAWNAIFGLQGREVKAGDWVLIQGTGGVSVAALQFAVAVGANVVATTSNQEKAKLLESLGARHVINYRQHPSWASVARDLTPSHRGFDLIVDVGGDGTLPQSLAAIRTDGIIALTGLLSMSNQPVGMLQALIYGCTVRGILLGSKQQFREMVRFVEEKNLHPILDFRTWDLSEARRAYDWLDSQKHFSKVVIRM
jgi:NADPH:quinone reductase-like Zn-dependent oxidoreductase